MNRYEQQVSELQALRHRVREIVAAVELGSGYEVYVEDEAKAASNALAVLQQRLIEAGDR
jgi:hypothetical protein